MCGGVVFREGSEEPGQRLAVGAYGARGLAFDIAAEQIKVNEGREGGSAVVRRTAWTL